MNKNIGIVLGIIAVAGIVYFSFPKDEITNIEVANPATETQNETTNTIATENEVALTETTTTTNTEITELVKEEATPLVKGSYEAYNPEKLANAKNGDVVLFFHASWCPSCRALNGDIDKNLSLIPDGVTILKTDYDTQTELKKKYGVTSQHTLVQVDENGNMIKKWSGGSKLTSLLGQIK
jgi:thiol-disulfide isomerase/thioredoxin